MDFYDNQVFSFMELKYQDRTIWFIRKRVATDRTYELHIYDRARAAPSNFPSQPIASSNTTLLWVSDLHFGQEHNFPLASNVHANNLSEAVRKDLESAEIKEIAGVILSGDLTWKADTAEYDNCRTFLENIKSWSTLSTDQIILCPGNHDLAFSRTPWQKGAAVDIAFDDAIKNFAEFYQGIFFLRPNQFLCSGRRFLLGNAIVVEIACLNSSLLNQVQGVFQGHGYLSDAQLEFAAEALGWRHAVVDAPRALRIVVLHHHVVPILYREVPVYDRQSSLVYDAGALCRWLAQWQVDLVLHGHMHDPAIVKESRRYGEVAGAEQWREFTVAALGSTGVKLNHTADNRNTYGILRFQRRTLSLELRQISRPVTRPPGSGPR
jgi:3',5'-cyclic AMP phosphodiesterase CpdA